VGGIGQQSSITGTANYYAGGGAGFRVGSTTAGGLGGGGSSTGDQVGAAGTASTGGGGGGGGLLSGTSGSNINGGAGGSGIVIVRYKGSSVGNIGGTITSGTGSAEGYTLHTFTNTGANSFNLLGVNMSTRLGATLTGNLSGTGTVYYSGPGTLTLTGTSNYVGSTVISGGTLQVGNGGTTGNIGTGNIQNHSALIFNRADNITVSNSIGGTGNLTKSGAGTLTLTGLGNTYAGGTFVTAGRLIGNTTTLQRNIVNNAELEFAQNHSNTFQGAVSGTGLLVKSGGGTLTLSGNNTHTGGTEVQAGVLATYGSNRLGNTGTMTINAGATLRIGGNQTLSNLSGAGNVELGNNSLTSGTISSTFSGTISGNGDLNKSGAGTLTLSGNNTFLGDTNIQNGTLVLASAGSLAQDAVVNLSSGAKLTVNQRTFIGALDQGGGIIDGPGELISTLTQTSSGSLNAVLSDGADFAAGILKRTHGTTTVGAAHTFTGSIKVQGGTLQLDTGGSFNSASSLVTSGGATMNLNGKSQTFSKISGVGGTIYLGAGNLTVNQSANSEYAGSINGSGSVIKSGAGALTLSASNSYTGETVVNAGELKVNGSIASSDVTINSGAALSGSGTVGSISGAGSINPGNSPGILTAAWIDPSDGMFLNFEITSIKPDYSLAMNSANDVLRITAANPFAAAMNASNEINVYFNVADFDLHQAFLGGIYTDNQADFTHLVSNATFNYYVQDNAGSVNYNGSLYSALSGYEIELSTVLDSANFIDGTVNGRIMQFSVVPEPSSALLAACGTLLLLQRRRKH
jgi:autotransporter-associated beta strand protein